MFGVKYTAVQERSFWLLDRLDGIDRKDEKVMQAIADEYFDKFGVRPRLVRCVPEYGPQRGKFFGYNIFE
jgi:hypothetical protein